MSAQNYTELVAHAGHDIVCVTYGDVNVAVECETCGEVLLDYDRELERKASLLRDLRSLCDYITGDEMAAALAAVPGSGQLRGLRALADELATDLDQANGRASDHADG